MKHPFPSPILAAALAALFTVSALADKTTNTFTRTSSQGESVAWNLSGVPNDYGTSAGSDVSLKIEYDDGAETFQKLELPSAKIWIDSVIGGAFHNLLITNSIGKYVVINDPTPFKGFWALKENAGTAKVSGLYLPDNGGAGKRTIGSAYVKGRFVFGVATGCEAELDYPFGIGMFEVNPNINSITSSTLKGKLTVNNSPGPYSVAQVRYGTLGIVGGEDDTSSPVPGAWARFDALAEDSFTIDAKGVTEWRDADGRPVAASIEGNGYNRPIRAVDDVTGKTLVNFGNRGGVAASSGGSRLKFPEAKDGIAEVFVVLRENSDTVAPSHLFGKAFPRSTSANSTDQLFLAWGSLPTELAMGEIRLNGQAVIPEFWYKRTRELTVVSAGYRSGGGSVLYIGGTEDSSSAGGAQIAEILFYTNTLSSAERRHNNDYLMKKWKGCGVRDYGVIMLANNTSLSVESGTAHVRELNLASNGFTKNGDGGLEIETLTTNLNTLAVNGGTVRFSNTLARPANPQPPADAVAWFDATDSAAFDTFVSNYNGTAYTFVTSWRDKRNNGYTLARPKPSSTKPSDNVNYANGDDVAAYPTLDTSTGDLPMVDLGPWVKPAKEKTETYGHFGWINGTSGLSTWLCLYKSDGNQYNSYNIRQGFVVFHKTDARGNPIQSHTWTMRNTDPANMFAHDTHAVACAVSGHWTYDGTTVNPSSVQLPADGKTHLGAFFLADNGQPVDIFGADMSVGPGGGGGGAGGCKIAEVILYTRYLTEQERLDTERYLMAKWNCGTHPANAVPTMGTLSFASGVPAIIDTDTNIVIGTVSYSASGTLAKKGTGTATVTTLSPVSQSALALVGGSLAVTDMTIADGAVLDVYFDATNHIAGTAAVSGTLTVGGSGTVQVHVPAGVTPQFTKYDILTATQVSGLSGEWSAQVVEGEIRGSVSVGYDPTRGAIYLNVSSGGTVLVFR